MNIYELLQSLGLSSGQKPEMGYTDLVIGDYAIQEAKKRFPDEGKVGGDQDAYRHLVWQANLQKDMPFLAKFIGNVHESKYLPAPIGGGGQGQSEREMDLYNNAIGRKIADQATSMEDINRLAEEYVRQKRVRTVPQSIIDAEYKYK